MSENDWITTRWIEECVRTDPCYPHPYSPCEDCSTFYGIRPCDIVRVRKYGLPSIEYVQFLERVNT